MEDGHKKPIRDIVPGDKVMAFDAMTKHGIGTKKAGRVRRVFRSTTRQMLNLRGLHVTAGHVVLSDGGEWLRIADVLRCDRAMVEERATGPVLVRGRTGAVIGSDDDIQVTVVFIDQRGLPHKAVVRAGIVCTAQRHPDGHYQSWSLARVLRHQGYKIEPNGTLTDIHGRNFNAAPWPGGTPLDAEFQHNWVVSVDNVPFVPTWIKSISEEDELTEVVRAGYWSDGARGLRPLAPQP